MSTRTTDKKFFIKCFGIIFLLISQVIILPLRIRGQSSPTQLKGNTRKVLTILIGTVDAGIVLFASDRDNDGMADDDELQNGTNPDDLSDADGDLDGDGVTNCDEVTKGTNPNVTDTDGDGVSDAEEIRLGWNFLIEKYIRLMIQLNRIR